MEKVTALKSLLDVSAMFDIVDYSIVLVRFSKSYGISAFVG